MSSFDYNDDEIDARSFLERHRLPIFLGVFVLVASVVGFTVFYFLSHGKIPPPRKPEEIHVTLVPPPPPPPPPPPKTPPPPPKPKMVVQTPVKPDEKKPEPKNDHPPATPGPKASGPPSDNGLANAGGGGDGSEIGGGDGGSKFGWYAAQVQSRIISALLQNPKTREASFHLKIRVWSDGTGRINRAEISGTTGDPRVDSAIKDEVLTGLQLQEPPPQDMPMPIVMQITERRPS